MTEGWLQLAAGGGGYSEGGSLSKIAVMVNSEEMSAATKPTVHGQLISSVNALRSARNQRFALSSSGLNPVKWAFTCFLDVIAIFDIALSSLEKKNQQIVASTLFFVVSTPTIVLLVLQANPFSGFGSVSPQPIQIALDHLTAAINGTR